MAEISAAGGDAESADSWNPCTITILNLALWPVLTCRNLNQGNRIDEASRAFRGGTKRAFAKGNSVGDQRTRCVIPVGLLLWLTGCVHLNHYTDFAVEDLTPPSDPGVAVGAYVRDHAEFKTVSAPLMLTKCTNEPPFAVQIRVEDTSQDCRQLIINQLVVDYRDGTSTSIESLPLMSRFEEREGKHIAVVEVPQALARRDSATLTARGVCITEQEERQPFHHRFQVVRSQKAGLLPAIQILNGV